MEDQNIKKLFVQFEPRLSSDIQFIERLQANLEAVECVKHQMGKERSCNKQAVAIAACAGFIAGFLFSLVLPFLEQAVTHWHLSVPHAQIASFLANNFTLIAWTIIGAATACTAINTYDISLSLLKHKVAA